jgi:hypothetical protein
MLHLLVTWACGEFGAVMRNAVVRFPACPILIPKIPTYCYQDNLPVDKWFHCYNLK